MPVLELKIGGRGTKGMIIDGYGKKELKITIIKS